MPPRGVKKGTKRARQYGKIKQSARRRGASKGRSKEIAARTVQKSRARSGESRTRSRRSLRGPSPSKRGGQRGGRSRSQAPTKEQLYRQAKRFGIKGRSNMNKTQLARAVGRKKR
jgi:hypothetical protein